MGFRSQAEMIDYMRHEVSADGFKPQDLQLFTLPIVDL
jgi:hypothetical protein